MRGALARARLGVVGLVGWASACGGVSDGTPLDPSAPIALGDYARTTPDTCAAALAATGRADGLCFAVVGDYGVSTEESAAGAALIAAWGPDFVVTTGDNNYPYGSATTIDPNVGRLYQAFIGDYKGAYGPGSETNRFWPALGNHDWFHVGAYLDYFTLPGNERYYEVGYGRVHLFVLDSDPAEPDGITADSVQGRWLAAGLARSTAPYKLVFDHHPPFNSGATHGSSLEMQWPFAEWGATAVFSGHEHVYERLERDGVDYFVNGAGGRHLYGFKREPVAGSQVRIAGEFGVMRVIATDASITYEFWTIDGRRLDTKTRPAPPG